MIVYTDKHRIPFIIDDDDYDIVKNYFWAISRYPVTNITIGSTRRSIPVHLLLLGKAPKGLEWDHADRDPLNNSRANLRPVTHAKNMRNRAEKMTTASNVTGVFRIRSKTRGDRWMAKIGFNNTDIYLGLFETIAEAAQARHDAEEILWK